MLLSWTPFVPESLVVLNVAAAVVVAALASAAAYSEFIEIQATIQNGDKITLKLNYNPLALNKNRVDLSIVSIIKLKIMFFINHFFFISLKLDLL